MCQKKDEELDQLRAHIERLRSVLDVKTSAVEEVLNETPAQSLNEIKAQAIEEAIDNVDWHCGLSPEALLDYAKQLRGEK